MKVVIAVYIMTLMQLMGSCNQKAEPETYLIPSGFTGKVNILFNKKTGAAEKYEGTRREYAIPSDGVLVSKFSTNDGFEDREYYYIDSTGKRTRLQIFNYIKGGTAKWIVSDKNEVGIFSDGTSGQYGNSGDAKSAQYQEFIVSSYNKLDTFYTNEYLKNFDSKIEKITGLTLNLK